MSELREQCTLEQQAKAHLEQELRSDLEEKDHKIMALQTKVCIFAITGVRNIIYLLALAAWYCTHYLSCVNIKLCVGFVWFCCFKSFLCEQNLMSNSFTIS